MRRSIPGIFLFGCNFVVGFGCLAWGRSSGEAIPVPYTLADGAGLTG